MNNIPYKSIIGGLNITTDVEHSYQGSLNYFSENIIFGVKAKDNKTVIEADALSGIVNIPKLQYYVNAYTLTYSINNTNAETNTNFINSYSTYIFPVVDATYSYISYHVAIMSYTLPTKHYVDKLLELKDAFIYRGTITPNENTSTNPGVFQATGQLNSEEGAMGISYTSAGSVYKIDSTGYFGDKHVHAGDMIISYSDLATTSSTNYWNVIETHITHDNISQKLLNTESSENRLLTNVKLLHNGTLTYTYTNLIGNEVNHTTTLSETNRKYVEFVEINNDNNNIVVTYNTKTLKFNNISSEDPNINLCYDSSYQFITNINQDIDGHLSYTYSIIKSHNHTTDSGVKNGISDIGNDNVNVLTGVNIDDSGKLTYTYTELKNPSLNNKNVVVSLFTGDNNVTYMLTTDNGNIKITQPIKQIYTTPKLLPTTTRTTITYDNRWVGTSYTIASPFGYNGVDKEIITIEFNGGVPEGTIIESIPITYSYYPNKTGTGTLIYNTHFTYSVSGSNLNIELNQNQVRQISYSVPSNSTFGFATVTATTTVASYTFDVTVNIGGNNINLNTTLSENKLTNSVTPRCNYYVALNGTDASSNEVNFNGRPSTLTTSSAGTDVRFIFPERWGTPTLKQLGAVDTAWKLIATEQISTYAYSGTTNKVNYKVYSHGAVDAKGTWDVIWSAW